MSSLFMSRMSSSDEKDYCSDPGNRMPPEAHSFVDDRPWSEPMLSNTSHADVMRRFDQWRDKRCGAESSDVEETNMNTIQSVIRGECPWNICR